jgi:hypothetical protein
MSTKKMGASGQRRRGVLLAIVGIATMQALHAQTLRLNQVQYLGSHNSYHAGLAPGEAAWWKRAAPEIFATIDYRHPALSRQFDEGIRQIELDVVADAKGGRYAHPAITAKVAEAGLPEDPPFADPQVMAKPGTKVLHVIDLDQRSTCEPLVACLQEVRAWSQAHPTHLPIFVLLETEDEKVPAPFPTVIPEPFDTTALDVIDKEIRSVFSVGSYITPDQVRGKAKTLNAAILAHGWPTLDEARGKVIFLLDQAHVSPAYLKGHPSLRGRVMFTHATPGTPDAAFVERNDGPAADITSLVKAGYLVRTRTDADLKEALTNDTRRRDAMLASGAQLLSTDYWPGEPAPSGYVVSFGPQQIARCNHVNASACPATLRP